MREKPLMSHDQMVAAWLENPKFRKAVFELNAQYADLDKALIKRKVNFPVQPGDIEKLKSFYPSDRRPDRHFKEGRR